MSGALPFILGGLILLPVAWFLGGIIVKLVWGLWPLLISVGAGAWMLWRQGMEAFVALPASLLIGILAIWLWQRTSLFLRVDAAIGRRTMLD